MVRGSEFAGEEGGGELEPFGGEGGLGSVFVEIEVVVYWGGIGDEVGFVEVFCYELVGVEGGVGGEVGEVGWDYVVGGGGEKVELLFCYSSFLVGLEEEVGEEE